MATINIPGAPTDVTPSIAESGVDINAANQGLGQTIQGYDNLMNMQFRDMDRAKLETNRAALLAQEAAFHANLDLPKQMIENQKQNIESTNKIAALEEAKNAGQLTQDAKIYTVNQMSNINAGLMDYQKQALSKMGPDGSGYTLDTKGWLLAQGQNAINNAPNSQAKVSMYLALHQLGNQVMQQGFQVEQKAKFDYNIKQSQDSVNGIANQIAADPMNSDHYTQQLEHVYDGLKGLGLMPDQLSKFKETSDKVIKTATVQSLVAKAGVDINQGSTEAMDRAIGLMSSDEYKQGLDKDTYQGLIKTVVEANDKIGLQAISQSDTAGAQKLITAGQALPNIPGVKTAADQAFMNFYSKSIVPQVTGNGIKDPISIGSTIKNYIGQNGIIGPQMKNMIENTIGNSKDPTQVAAMAQGLYQAVREGGVSASTLAKEVSPGTFKQALAIADAMNSGADYKSAVIDVRTAQLNIAQNPSLQKGMEKIIQNEDVNNLAKQAANKWFEPTVNDPAMQASIKSLFKTEYAASDGDKATAEANTVQKLSKAGAMTDVNGSKEFMFGAPEMFWQGAELSQAKQLISDKLVDVGQKVLGKELGDEGKAGIVYGSGIKFSDGTQLGIQSVPGVTLFQPNNNKTYQVWDMKANTPVLDRQGLPVRFSVNTDLTQVGKDRQAAIDTYNKQREDLNQKIKDRNNLVETTLGWK